MPLDVRTAQTDLENAVRDAILFALGKRLDAVANVAALRALRTRGDSGSMRGDDDLIPIVVAGVVTASYRWSSVSAAADDGDLVIKPADVAANGRWLRWTSELRIAFTKGGNSQYLHELETGPLERVLLFDKGMSDDETLALLNCDMPAVVIDAQGDDPEDATQNTGHKYFSVYTFNVHVLTEQLRDRREAAQGSSVPGETTPGANALDGWVKALLGGTQLRAVIDGIRNVRPGSGDNSVSMLAQRRVVRSREYSFFVTEEYPNAPNDTGPAEEVDTQRVATDLGTNDAFDPDNYLVDGITVTEAPGFVKPIAAGSAVIAGVAVAYAGELYNFAPNSATYRDLLPNGTLGFVIVDLEEDEPPVTATALRIGRTLTDGSGVTDDSITAERRTPLGNPIQTPLT